MAAAVESGAVVLERRAPQQGEGGETACESSVRVPLLKDVFGTERRNAKVLNFSIASVKTSRAFPSLPARTLNP